ncbi:plk/plk-unclassified protein kinase [Thecamonas trahens ATCC 50062]|uniref:Serine/threonine-protein kinase PLK n=1 Tax=Thecamonas trahens ATCC 50062 TaxID=461836 RepID=A0A0L0DVH9_THETB|nr:plk/plk-unclassified protein kinase [Thecamonas trahens ATCC 50062]KNC56230.1 plk/plk-unclassified protein kinase [Thecamonas trahens ATCC 50062]|eukprot:XP_013752649.1 plk/plk-unclassified protein kinase [Thecamonas trahens ATCC 50062]
MSYPIRTQTAGVYNPLSRRTAAATAARPAARTKARKSRSKVPSEPPPDIVRNATTGAKYKTGALLGKGGFARVYKFQDMATGKVYAGKVVAKSSITGARARAKLKSEIKLHRSLDHENIVSFVQFMEDSKFVYILLEICTNGSFMELLKARRQLTEPEVAYYMWQLLEATEYMHARNIIHRDLKLGNLFIDDKLQVKVGDFGLATSVEHKGERKKTICGTPNYIAPEILDSRNNGHSFEVDIWSIGVILYTMIIGKPPFETSKLKTTYNLIKTNTYSFPPDKPISEAARSLIRSMLQARPSARPTIAEIKAHRFFSDNPIPASLPPTALKRAPLHSELFGSSADGAAPSTLSLANKYAADGGSSSAAAIAAKYASRAPLGERASARSAAASSNYTEALKAKYGVGSGGYAAKAKAKAKATASATDAADARPSSGSAGTTKADDDDSAALRAMHDKLTKSFALMNSGKAAAAAAAPDGAIPSEPAKWVIKWVDYSNKYGLGYQLSDGTIGVYFNDSTKIVLSSNGTNVDYVERLRSSAGSRDLAQSVTMEEYPESLNKKMTLLTYFKNYLMEHLERADKDGESSSSTRASSPGISAMNVPDAKDAPTAGMVYVKKWLRTKHAIIFRLSDKTVQVNFFDHTKIILSSEAQIVTYVDKQRNTSTHTLQAVMVEQSPDLVNRLTYCRQILSKIASKASSKQTAA